MRMRSCFVRMCLVRLGHHDGQTVCPITCLSHEDGGISLCVFHTAQQANLLSFSLHHSYALNAKQGGYKYHFLKSFDLTLLGN